MALPKIESGVKSFIVVLVMVLVVSALRYEPGNNADLAAGQGAGTDSGPLAGDAGTAAGEGVAGPGTEGVAGTAGSAGTAGTAGGGGGAAGAECKAGRNGGNTDTGVTGNQIRLATTAVLDGPARSLLGDSPVAMKAVVDKVNKAGGICGRLLDLRVVNDSFKPEGSSFIRSFAAEGYFALPVVPSAEGLGAAIKGGVIARAGIPVVGTDGMREEQYNEQWVWPVASATVTSMRVMAKYGATNRGAKTFAIVWDGEYKFGQEGKDAFEQQVKAMGLNLVATARLDPDQQSYASEAEAFNGACGSSGEKCDMVAMLLLPDTAKKWLQRRPARGRLYTAGAQTLFTDRFAQDCVQQIGGDCHGFAVWTGYNPPIGPLATLPGVAAYVSDVRALKPDIDINNQFIEGSYLGMSVFVEALKAVGPNLTRARLKAQLDSMDFKNDLASTLSWRPGNHAANVRSQSFSMTVSGGTFRGWTNDQSGFILDPARGG
ncbi:MAG TPA: ABC transporter substrate-binding protein [Acidimicrobiales bacterium]|nr:ABC transporter substrate-binding protein [Acidimicrobiales bacterium]